MSNILSLQSLHDNTLSQNDYSRKKEALLIKQQELSQQDDQIKNLILQLQHDSLRKEKEIENAIAAQLQLFSMQENQRYSELLQRQQMEQQRFEALMEEHQQKLQQATAQEHYKETVQAELHQILKKLETLDGRPISELGRDFEPLHPPTNSLPPPIDNKLNKQHLSPNLNVDKIAPYQEFDQIYEPEIQTHKKLPLSESQATTRPAATASENLQTLNDIEKELEQLKELLNTLQSPKAKNPFASLPATPKEKQHRDLDASPEPFPIQKPKLPLQPDKPHLMDSLRSQGSDTTFFMDTYYRSRPSLRTKLTLPSPFEPINKSLSPKFSFVFKKP